MKNQSHTGKGRNHQISLSAKEYGEIITRLDKLDKAFTANNITDMIDNSDFIRMMKISRRLAQSWRDEGKISFSQVGGKIYYRRENIYEMLNKNYNRSFARAK